MKSALKTLPDFLLDLGEDARGAEAGGGERATVCLRKRGDSMTDAAGEAAAGLDGLMGGVMIFLMMSLVLMAFMAAAAAARTGGGAEVMSCDRVVGQETDGLLNKNPKRAEAQTATMAIMRLGDDRSKLYEEAVALLMA